MMSLVAVAAPRTQAQMKQAALKAINAQRTGKKMAPRKAAELKTLKTTDSYQIIGTQEGGFAVIAADDLVPEVLGVSTKHYSNGQNENFQWWLEAVEGAVKYAVQHRVALKTTLPDPNLYPAEVAPMLTTEWDQDEPYNRLLPESLYGGGRCVTGCVATAMAQVLNYFQTPTVGIGTRTIYYPQGNYTGTPITATFGEDFYDWDNMLDIYTGDYSETEAMAVALLMRDCGVAADMQYGGSNNVESGSGAYSEDAAEGLRTYFGIAEAQCLSRDSYSESAWMDIVYRTLSEDGPCYYGGASWSSGGHAFVLHGYNAEGKVYVNWGWSGDDDGYYDIAVLDPGYYIFNMQQDMIIGIKGEPRVLSDEVVAMTQAGTLSSQLGDDKIGTVGTLKVTGDINSSDLRQIRRIAGVDENGEKTGGYLQTLDLSEARIVSGGDAYLIDYGQELTTADDELPEKAFMGCKYLKNLNLPAGLKKWGEGALALCPQLKDIQIGAPAEDADFVVTDGIVTNLDQTEIVEVLSSTSGEFDIDGNITKLHNYAVAGCARVSKVKIPSSVTMIGRGAFQGCSGLQEIRVAGKVAPTLGGADVFKGVSVTSCYLFVPSGMKETYEKLAQWKEFKNIKEFGSSVKVRNTYRLYGEENPQFYYIKAGDPFEGEPELSCEATINSPAGKYTISISRGTIVDESVELIDGYMIIQKVKAKATVQDATREAGQENPEFTLAFEGLVNDETEPVWITEPVFTCEATVDSPEGEYPITVTAEAESYKLTFVAGTLTVTPSTTGIRSIDNGQFTMDNEVYNLNGQRVAQPTKGLYIRDGKKVIK